MSVNILANPDATHVEALVKTALKPGNIVTFGTGGDAGKFVGAAANAGGFLLVLDMDPMGGGGIETAYTADNTARAERLIPGKTYNVRIPSTAATYEVGSSIQVGANSEAVAQSGTHPVVGYVAEKKVVDANTASTDLFVTFFAA